MAFVDEAKFFVKAGDGGRGCLSFRREKFVPKGGPDGGDGGEGGSVYLVADRSLLSLMDFRYRSHFIAANGGAGKGKKMHGRKGRDCEVRVPLGSIVKDAESGEVLADLVEDGARFLAARGGRGGLGNVHFATAQNRAPRKATPGRPGEERWLKIELKLMADVGLVGLPNAGKSTLLSRLSAANPKIADYPFTTLRPQLGILQFDDFHEPCVIADIPGLIEGAHEGVGLGHQFLRHIERTRVLLHVIDISCGSDGALEDFEILEDELRRYKDELARRRRLIVLNKIDQLDDDAVAAARSAFRRRGLHPLAISALNGDGLAAVKEEIARLMDEIEDEAAAGGKA